MIEVVEEPAGRFETYGEISSAFDVSSVLELREEGFAGFVLVERPLEAPYRKDYDAIEGNTPADWASEFDVRSWGVLAARLDGRRVGGAVVLAGLPEIHMLEGRNDLAVLWDIRVGAEWRGRGMGSALFEAASSWARRRGCRQLKVETQNINVPACRFYQRQGCVLGGINRFAYPELPHEIQLLWFKTL